MTSPPLSLDSGQEYIASMDGATMHAEELAQIGTALYGPEWQTPLALEIGVTDRTVRRWAAGDTRVGADPKQLAALCKQYAAGYERRARQLRAMATRLQKE